MAAIAFGRFTLHEGRGDTGSVVIAPGHILLQRQTATALHDLSYLAIWTEQTVRAVTEELAALAATGPGVVTANTPTLASILHAIAPAAAATFHGRGSCRGFLARRQLTAALRTRTPLARTA
jgi:hypothetical protein